MCASGAESQRGVEEEWSTRAVLNSILITQRSESWHIFACLFLVHKERGNNEVTPLRLSQYNQSKVIFKLCEMVQHSISRDMLLKQSFTKYVTWTILMICNFITRVWPHQQKVRFHIYVLFNRHNNDNRNNNDLHHVGTFVFKCLDQNVRTLYEIIHLIYRHVVQRCSCSMRQDTALTHSWHERCKQRQMLNSLVACY